MFELIKKTNTTMFRKKTYSLELENSQIHLEQTCNKIEQISTYHLKLSHSECLQLNQREL